MRPNKTIILVSLFILIGFARADETGDYAADIARWRADREANLKKETGWLTVAGLSWLKEGRNTVGRGDEFDVRLTDNFKGKKFGEIEFRTGTATLRIEAGVDAKSDGKTISGPVNLVSDEKEKPTEIRTGSQTFYLIKREDRFGIRVKDSKSEARRNFRGLHWFPIDESYRVTARFEPFPESKEVAVPNVLGGNFKMKSPGVLKFSLKGRECALQPVDEGDGTLFIIFRDKSSENETYKSGRFLYADKPANGQAVLDFNKAENPPCAFTPFATCPLPPPGNRLDDVEIAAGEKRYDH